MNEVDNQEYVIRNIVFCRNTSDKFIAENKYVCAVGENIQQSMLDSVQVQLRPELQNAVLIGTSCLGHMTKEQFNTHTESISSNADASHHYLLVFRSPTGTFSIIINKDTPIITKPTIDQVKRENLLSDYILVSVEELGFYNKDYSKVPVGTL